MANAVYSAPVPGLETCWAVLSEDPVRYLDLTEPVARGDGVLLDACPAGALVRLRTYDRPGQAPGYSMFAKDPATARRLLDRLPPNVDFIMVHEDFYLPDIQARFRLDVGKPCWQTAYLGPPVDLPQVSCRLGPLTRADLPTVLAHYDLEAPDYLAYLIDTGGLLGAFDGDALMGFIGRHAEGSLGLLEVLPQYRRRGLAQVLEGYLLNQELALGHVPFGQVFAENEASLALQRRLGLTLSRGQLRWMLVL